MKTWALFIAFVCALWLKQRLAPDPLVETRRWEILGPFGPGEMPQTSRATIAPAPIAERRLFRPPFESRESCLLLRGEATLTLERPATAV